MFLLLLLLPSPDPRAQDSPLPRLLAVRLAPAASAPLAWATLWFKGSGPTLQQAVSSQGEEARTPDKGPPWYMRVSFCSGWKEQARA